jgi:hypothetical protein
MSGSPQLNDDNKWSCRKYFSWIACNQLPFIMLRQASISGLKVHGKRRPIFFNAIHEALNNWDDSDTR